MGESMTCTAPSRVHGGNAQIMGLRSPAGSDFVLDFSVNVNPLGPSPAALAAASEELKRSDAYPDRNCYALRQSLGECHGIDLEAIVCGNGASDLIWRLAAATCPSEVLVCAPTFSEYGEAARFFGARVREFALDTACNFDVTASFAQTVTPTTDIVFVCNPNNPTGRLVDSMVLESLAQRCEETGALLVVDECFLGFHPHADELSLARRAARSQHIAVLNAFTKTFGLAGLRLGYLITGNERLRASIIAAGQAWPVSSIAQAAGIAALKDVVYLDRARQLVTVERSWLASELEELGFVVVPSSANFLLLHSEAGELPQRLFECGILVRPCSSFSGLDDHWIRIAVRTRNENIRLIRALESIVKRS